MSLPLVGVPACYLSDQEEHRVEEGYLRALVEGARVLPLLIPALGAEIDYSVLLSRLDGVFIPGSRSNIEPWRYRRDPVVADDQVDPKRDETTLRLIPEALKRELPLFAVCRGAQELNVALGGTLHQRLSLLPDTLEHRVVDEKFDNVHWIRLSPQGYLRTLSEKERVSVNSLHMQGIDRLSERLEIEAVAEDGVIEAVRVKETPTFAIGTQWHPEVNFQSDPLSRALFEAFGNAVASAKAAIR